ncbi:MAG: polyprenyl synthetase family protein [Balneolaceae bacterium]|nr:polyprenyl synthetase family protein [Balneolaceae bacterium]
MDFLKPYAALIESEIHQLQLPGTPETLYAPQRYILSSKAKRVRPILTLMAAGMCGESIEKSIPAALAVELVHNFSLIHDDIMDQADSRRGNATVHVKWDASTAILSGDGMLIQAILQLQNLPPDVDYKKINRIFLNGINKVCEGQASDMEFEDRLDVTTDEYLEMISGKTAALIAVSLVMGGICAKADDEKLEALNEIGYSLGKAFQIQDDILDVIADPEKFGKRKGGDIYEGKKTYLMLQLLEHCNKDDKNWLINCLKNKTINDDDVLRIIELYESYGITDEAKSVMNQFYAKAEKALQLFEETKYKGDLSKLINFLKNREY